ncbi:MAG: hypothetical protein J7484_06210 [Microbacterium sp.]|nr:hypothetical protein [Microbacterium sp.]
MRSGDDGGPNVSLRDELRGTVAPAPKGYTLLVPPDWVASSPMKPAAIGWWNACARFLAAEELPGFVDGDEARTAMAAAISRPPVTNDVIGRVWHVLGPEATGAVVDLSVGGAADSPLPHSLPQRTVPFEGGRAVFSLVAPRERAVPALLLRVQRTDGERTLIADAIESPAVLGMILDDVITLVGGAPGRAS